MQSSIKKKWQKRLTCTKGAASVVAALQQFGRRQLHRTVQARRRPIAMNRSSRASSRQQECLNIELATLATSVS